MTQVRAKIPAVFLDRDGTLMLDVDYCGNPAEVRVFEGASKVMRSLKESGYKLIVITNQSGIGRGYFNEDQYRAVEAEVSRQLGTGLIDTTYYCPHLPADHCKCRKPSPEMVVRAADDHELDLARSFLIGDKQSDMECGRAAGVKTILMKTGYGKQTNPKLADYVADDLGHAADLILKRRQKQ